MAIAVHGSGPVNSVISSTFDECGLRISAPEYADVVVLLGRGHIDALDPHEETLQSRMCRSPHLHQRLAPRSGPLVVPGRTPC